MPKVKVKRKSTFIDMTAMSDVTVLLLTFFMLTATFVKKEPVQVVTPASVSEIKIPESNLITVIIEKNGNVYMSIEDNKENKAQVLKQVGEVYKYNYTPQELKKFSELPSFGVPIQSMKEFLDLPTEKQDAIITQLKGIPTDTISSSKNQFENWVRAALTVNPKLAVAIKSDASTPYLKVKSVMKTLQDLEVNRYNLITSLKTVSAADADIQ